MNEQDIFVVIPSDFHHISKMKNLFSYSSNFTIFNYLEIFLDAILNQSKFLIC